VTAAAGSECALAGEVVPNPLLSTGFVYGRASQGHSGFLASWHFFLYLGPDFIYHLDKLARGAGVCQAPPGSGHARQGEKRHE
jgi:hypothetical protein